MDMKLYISDTREHFDLCGAELLEEERRIRLYRYRRLEDQARCLTAGLMLRCVLGKDAAACITLSRFGKPFLPGGPCFNLSHSGDKVVLLVDDKQMVGVDVERIDAAPLTVAKKVFTASEQQWLWHQAKDEAFFRLWTGKEAIMKALGLGLQLPPESFHIHPDSDSANAVRGYDWYLHWLEIDGHMICTATGRSEAPQNPVLLTKSELLQKEITRRFD